MDNRIDVIATDHAPHTLEEKLRKYDHAPSGGPLVQHALLAMLEKVKEGYITVEIMVEKMAHAPAILFRIENRGFLREGFAADIVLVNPALATKVKNEEVLYKCAWTPFNDYSFSSAISKTFVNGNLVFSDGKIQDQGMGQRLTFRV